MIKNNLLLAIKIKRFRINMYILGNKMNKLHKMSAEVLAQMVENESTFKNFAPGLKSKVMNIGMTATLASLLALSSGLAHADDNNALKGMFGASALVGLLTNNTKQADQVNCDVQGTSGLKVGVSGALGSYVGNQMGGGNGKVATTIAGGILGAVIANSQENERIRGECSRVPRYNSNTNQSAILYEGRTTSGNPYYVTENDSIGLAGLSGKKVGELDVNSDPIVKTALEKSSVGLVVAYDNLDILSRNYIAIVSGKTTVGKISRYAVDENEIAVGSAANAQNQIKIANAKIDFDEAYNQYASRRAVFANIADNAASDNFNITSYGKALPYVSPPPSASVVYNGKLPNRYRVIPGAIKP